MTIYFMGISNKLLFCSEPHPYLTDVNLENRRWNISFRLVWMIFNFLKKNFVVAAVAAVAVVVAVVVVAVVVAAAAAVVAVVVVAPLLLRTLTDITELFWLISRQSRRVATTCCHN